MNVLLINDSSSNPNWGDRAAAIALKRMIAASGATITGIITEEDLRDSRFSGEATVEFEPKEGGRSIKDWASMFLPPVLLKLRGKILNRLQGANAEPTGPIPLTMDDFERCAGLFLRERVIHGILLDAIEKAEVVVIHGDGCMVGNGILPRSELFLSYLIKTRFCKPVILINHTTDFSHPELNRMAEAVYPLLDDVTYRDQTSTDLCSGRWPGRYAADSAFLFEPAERDAWARLSSRPTYFDVWPDRAPFDPARPYMCVGGSSIYSFGGTPTDVIAGFISLVFHLQKVYQGQIVLTASDLKDQAIFRSVAKTLRLPLVGLTTPVQQAVDVIGNAQAYVGGRWHPSIFALRGGTPVIPLSSKTFKMQALIAMAGLPTTTFNALDLPGEKEGIGQALITFVGQGENLRRQLSPWAAKQAANSWDNVAFLRHRIRPAAADRADVAAGVNP
jgi:polysaccharide pyruvyl transferase WcaK-like protein